MDDLKTMRHTAARRRLITQVSIFLLALWPASSCLADLAIKGLDNGLKETLIAQSPLGNASCDVPTWWIEKQLDKTHAIATHLLETQGFYTPTLSSSYTLSETCWHAELSIEKGQLARYGDIRVQGIERLELNARQLGEIIPSSGTGFTHASYERIKSSLLDHAQAKGFLQANWQVSKATVTLPQSNNQSDAQTLVDVELSLALGPLSYMGDIHHQVPELDGDFLHKFHNLKSGLPLTRQALDQAYQHLISTGYLGSLAITPQYEQTQDQQVPLTIEGTPASKRSYEIGAGYSTDSGLRTRGEILWRRINARGDRARLTAKLAETARDLSGEYRRPDADDPRNRWWSVGVSYEFDQPDTFKREKTALALTQSVRRDSAWMRTNVLQYSTESWRIADTNGDTQLISLGQGWQRSHAEGRGRLPSGRSLNLSWRTAAKALGSDLNVLQLQAAYKAIHTLNNDWRLLGRVHAGINVVDDLDLLPPDLRFFAGGDNSVRGYDLDTLGEIRWIDDQAVVVGGKRVLNTSIEFDRAIKKDWSAAVFIDAGSAFNTTPDMALGAGIGARWYSPIGPIRIDIAHGFDGLTPGWRLHISFGAEL
jgi:translocation and assembly module TamA